MQTKVCSKCKIRQPLASFYKGGGAGRKRGECIVCVTKMVSEWTRSNPGRAEARAKAQRERNTIEGVRVDKLKQLYGMTLEDYKALLEAQGGCCALCGTDTPGRGHRRLHVDHDHTSGRVRGLLCNNCNRGLGLLQDSEEILEKALSYLRRSR